MSLANNFERIKATLPTDVKLVVVTKNQSPERIDEVIRAGAKIIGENRIQEAKEKFPKITLPVEKHFIGHLQTNKVKDAVELFDMIESVDSVRLAEKINKEAKKTGKLMPILLQINIGNDPNKYGFSVEEVPEATKQIDNLAHLEIKGFMTIVPYPEDPEETRPYFQAMKALQKKGQELSMGMSHDYQIAIEEGATMVRIGSAIFEE